VIDHDPKIGNALRKHRHMLQVTRQNTDIVEGETAAGQDLQPVKDGRSDDPIRIRLDIHQVSNADEGALVSKRIEHSFRLVRQVQRYPANDARDPIMGARSGEQRLVFRLSIRRLDRDRVFDSGGV
jgi:hypothetical protein